jgi:hypothetical protein
LISVNISIFHCLEKEGIILLSESFYRFFHNECSCGRPACVRPAFLTAGNGKKNLYDKVFLLILTAAICIYRHSEFFRPDLPVNTGTGRSSGLPACLPVNTVTGRSSGLPACLPVNTVTGRSSGLPACLPVNAVTGRSSGLPACLPVNTVTDDPDN